MRVQHVRAALAAATAIMLTACGGGGGGGVAFNPPPPPTPPPPPPPPTSVTIFTNPTPGEYASIGASIAGSGGNLDTYANQTDRFGDVSSADPNQPHIRYISGGYYEIQMPGEQWDRLVPYAGLVNPPADNNYFQPSGVAQNEAYIATNNSRNNGYAYSEIGSWGSIAAGRTGVVAFGTPTPASAVPVTGTATFSGDVYGTSDVMTPDNLLGGFVPTPVVGEVTLNFNFGTGTLGGNMRVNLADGVFPGQDLGTLSFTQTVFSVGSATYSGKFATSVSGDNFFLGRFTGPNAQETVGAWALPFVYTGGVSGAPTDNEVHQAFGAWIAKRP